MAISGRIFYFGWTSDHAALESLSFLTCASPDRQ